MATATGGGRGGTFSKRNSRQILKKLICEESLLSHLIEVEVQSNHANT